MRPRRKRVFPSLSPGWPRLRPARSWTSHGSMTGRLAAVGSCARDGHFIDGSGKHVPDARSLAEGAAGGFTGVAGGAGGSLPPAFATNSNREIGREADR